LARGVQHGSPTEETVMHFQLRTDNHITNSDELAARVRAEVDTALVPRLGDRLRRVEVYLEDTNAHKKGGADVRCTVEVHLAGLPAMAAEDRAAELDQAVEGAMEKLQRVLDHKLGRIEDRAGRTSAAGEPG
jgi:ribosome-associated translation inhibitor RaiA